MTPDHISDEVWLKQVLADAKAAKQLWPDWAKGTMTPDTISDEARKLWEVIQDKYNYHGVKKIPIIQCHLDAYAKQAVDEALAEVKCYNCGELAVRL